MQLQRVMEREQSKAKRASSSTAPTPDATLKEPAAHHVAADAAAGPGKQATVVKGSPLKTPPPGPLDSEHVADCLEGGMISDQSVTCLAAAIHMRLKAGQQNDVRQRAH